jgi:citrate lyase subunit beta / citryl-CoA lyase
MATRPAKALPRSYLYCPGDRPDRLAKAGERGADALIADLEDAVAPDRKELARAAVADWLAGRPGGEPRPGGELWIRVNAGLLAADIRAVVTAPVSGAGVFGAGVTGVVLPKADRALAAAADDLLSARERELGLPRRSVSLLPLIETAGGLQTAAELATAPRVVRLGMGEADLAAELGVDLAARPRAFDPLRLQLVVASAAAGIAAPVGPASTDFRDVAALRASTEALSHLGFRARTAIHPGQVETINTVFTPSADQVSRAAELIAAFDAAGSGVMTGPDGAMVDAAVLRAAHDVLARARLRRGDVVADVPEVR